MAIRKEHVSDRIFNIIEEKIFSGEWEPGTKIMSEPQLSKELHVSRMSVREAIEKMVALNILTKKHGEGTFVNDLKPSIYLNSLIPMITLDRDDYIEILEFRLIVEVESARLCAEKISEEGLIELEKCYEEMERNHHDGQKFAEADLNFHMKIAEGTENSLIIKVNTVLKNLLKYHQRTLYKTLGPAGGLTDHKNMVDALKKRDADLSALFMKRHIERTLKDIKKMAYKG